jgi:hypothetical protein
MPATNQGERWMFGSLRIRDAGCRMQDTGCRMWVAGLVGISAGCTDRMKGVYCRKGSFQEGVTEKVVLISTLPFTMAQTGHMDCSLSIKALLTASEVASGEAISK